MAIEDETKKYYEPKAPAEKAMWMDHKVRKYTQPGATDVQFDGGTKKDTSRKADQDYGKPENPLPQELGPVQLPWYMTKVADVIKGIREEKTVNETRKLPSEYGAEGKHLVGKHVPNIGDHIDFYHPGDNGKNKHYGKVIGGGRQPDKDGAFGEIHIKHAETGKTHRLKLVREEVELDEAFPPKKKDDKKDKKKDKKGPPKDGDGDGMVSDKKAADVAKDNEQFQKKNDKEDAPPEEEDDDQEDDDQEVEGDEEDDNAEEKAPDDDQNVTQGINGSEVKTSLETIALQAAELFAEVDEKQAFDSEIKDAVEAAVEAIGKIHAVIMNDDGEVDDTDKKKPEKGPEFQDAGDDPSQKFQKEETISEVTKNLVGRYMQKASDDYDRANAKYHSDGENKYDAKNDKTRQNRFRGMVTAAGKLQYPAAPKVKRPAT